MKGVFGVEGMLDDWKKGDIPANQEVDIVLNSFSRLENGNISLTARLASDDEVDFEVDRLIRDLEAVRKQAKINIKITNERIRDSR